MFRQDVRGMIDFPKYFQIKLRTEMQRIVPFQIAMNVHNSLHLCKFLFYFCPLFPAVDEYITNFFSIYYIYINLPSKISYIKGTNISRVYIKLHIMRSSLYCSVIKCKKCVSYKKYSYEDYHCQKTIVIVIVSEVCLI